MDVFSPPDPSTNYSSLLEETKNAVEDVSDDTVNQLASLAGKNYIGQMILFVFKLATLGFLVYTVTTIAARILRGLAGVLINAVDQLSPYLAAIIGFAIIVYAWEFLSSEISTPDQKQRAFRKLKFWDRRSTTEEKVESVPLKAVKKIGKTGD